ncbi:hypothetical protein NP493_498g02048 [Ridgeia piscesae]|uniref:Elongation of very long chain fatty acids protein n=1 Tax=Ridgeia piscesae TaxID=27915 RepID=A0AAD9KXU9_RIDPI|nr:hypothetical protein NP493_498g02048 [Ridgeia piscesae]
MTLVEFIWLLVQLRSFPVFLVYLSLVVFARPWQKWTAPVDLHNGLLLYNFTCSCCSAATCAAFLHGLWHSEHIFDKTPQPALQLAFRLYWLCKLGELLDTVFMILRHRKHQISILHVYHHASMLLLSEFAWQHSAWPAIAVLLALNSLVHVFLYIYYALSTCPQVSVPSRWRQALTEIQILQFVIAIIYCLVGYFNHGFCVYSLVYGAVMTFLFSHFYYYAYVNRASTKQCRQ